jgi:uncharacterized metal-binding protein YceD (DUF177 family)
MAITSEFSRIVRLEQLGSKPWRQRIEATPEEREGLCRRFELLSLDRLTAMVELYRENGEVIRLETSFEAEFVQSCAVTDEPVAGAISDRFSLLYGPPEEEPQQVSSSVDEPAFEPLVGETIDIGEAVAQELSLVLPLFPRHADSSIEIEFADTPIESPFASLGRLRRTDD